MRNTKKIFNLIKINLIKLNILNYFVFLSFGYHFLALFVFFRSINRRSNRESSNWCQADKGR